MVSGALDGTHIKVNVSMSDRLRYRSRKGDITTNVLGVCSQNGEFIFVMPRWEGSVSDSRVLRDAVSRPIGLKVPKGATWVGYYYLCEASYPNAEGFLAPYREATFEEPHLSEGDSSEMNIENINFVETTNVWTEWRDNLANQMFEDWNNMASTNSKATKHRWTTIEDEALVECLLQLVEEGGWRADDGTFKPGYLVQVQKLMKEKIHGSNIQLTPILESSKNFKEALHCHSRDDRASL
ncbi:retrotransposon protein [Cucumis melo var. makuwa]|uniref:Retrotransposon protein n=1 Tax=Cucumis melo var. makuwa TaxID=1194695 RepID=A0A5D3CWW4_CUCMM|nr:retrotransposon protein [Cucumis melo var. makuwa]